MITITTDYFYNRDAISDFNVTAGDATLSIEILQQSMRITYNVTFTGNYNFLRMDLVLTPYE